MLLDTLIRQVNSTTQLLRDHNGDIRKAMLERATEMVRFQGAPRSSLAGPSALMKLEMLAYELLETVDAVRREQYGAGDAGGVEGRESLGGHATPPCHERKRMRSADDNGDEEQLVSTAATATPSGVINHDNSGGNSADAGAMHPTATRGGAVAAAVTTICINRTTPHTTPQTLPASALVASNHDLMHHVISFAVGEASVRGMTRLACVSRAWRHAVHSAHDLWMQICHHCLPFTLPEKEDVEEGKEGGIPVVVKGLLRSAGGYKGVVMQHREAVWRYDQLRRAHEAERNSGCGEEGRSRRWERPQVVMKPRWFEHMTIIFEVFDRFRGQCMLSMIGRGELANGRDMDDESEASVLTIHPESVWDHAFRVTEMIAPWDVYQGTEYFAHDDALNTERYFGQGGRFVVRLLGVKRGGGMQVLHAADPGAAFDFEHVGSREEDFEHICMWSTSRSDVTCAQQMGFPLRASFHMYLLRDVESWCAVELAPGENEPRLYFDLTAGPRYTQFPTVVDFMYAALS